LFFLALNNWLLEQAGGRWDRPSHQDLIDEGPVRERWSTTCASPLRSPRASRSSARRYLRRTPEALTVPWD
jgi:hypothetical protein